MVETMTSGKVVPMETTVAPMSSSGRWNRRASAERTVNKPVTAFNKEQQTDDKQQYRDKHIDSVRRW